MKRAVLLGSPMLVVSLAAGAARAQEFSYNPPGQLVPGSGEGRVDRDVYAPGMRFPIEAAPAFANSQVWGHGGSQGPGGTQCDVENFSYPWWDNYCETRQWDMPLCPAGTGHQGQDIRAASCDNDVHWVVAAEAGAVTNVGTYSVYITADDGTRYDYLHMGSVQVGVGQEVAKGERIGRVSNEFGGTPTTVHLHFNLRQNVQGIGDVYVPTYMSLVTSYQALVGGPVDPGEGALDEATCAVIRGWAASPAALETAIEARLYFDGEKGDGTVGHPVLADYARDDLCAAIGSCDHGFEVDPPLALFDGLDHSVRAYASDGTANAPELGGSPKSMACTFELPSGVRRKIAGRDAANAWRFSSFWDEVAVSEGIVTTLEEGAALDAAPRVVTSASSPDTAWIVDGGVRRGFESVRSMRAWDVHPGFAELLSDADLAAIPEGKPMRPRPVVLSSGDELWLVDEADVEASTGSAGANGPGGGAEDEGGGCDCAAASRSAPASAALLPLALAVLARRRRTGR